MEEGVASGGAAGGAADSAAKAAEKAPVINLVSDDEMEAGMSPKGGAPDEAQARDIMFGETWVCPMCTCAENPFFKRRSGKRMSLPCKVCGWGD